MQKWGILQELAMKYWCIVREIAPIKIEILLEKQGQMPTVNLVKEFKKNKERNVIKVCFLNCLEFQVIYNSTILFS